MRALTTILLALFLFFNLALPKAGTKLEGFPLYVSLILAFVFFVLIIPRFLKNRKENEEKMVLFYLLSLIIVFFAAFFFFHSFHPDFKKNFLDVTPYMVSLSSILFVFLAKYYPDRLTLFKNVIVCSFFLVTVYGLIQKIFGDVRTIIPGITFNFAEAMEIPSWWSKSSYIHSLNYIKLTSTYQNGNLFGVNYLVLSWFAFYFLKEKKDWIGRIVLILSLAAFVIICLLTASRTVYAGLLFSGILFYILMFKKVLLDNKKQNEKKYFFIGLSIAALILAISAFLFIPPLNYSISKIIFKTRLLEDPRIKELTSYLKYIWDHKLLFQFLFGSIWNPLPAGGAYEVTLAAIFVKFGLIFTSVFITAIVYFMKKLKLTLYNIGLFSYIFASLFDGAFWLPPTPINFFTFLGVSYFALRQK